MLNGPKHNKFFLRTSNVYGYACHQPSPSIFLSNTLIIWEMESKQKYTMHYMMHIVIL